MQPRRSRQLRRRNTAPSILFPLFAPPLPRVRPRPAAGAYHAAVIAPGATIIAAVFRGSNKTGVLYNCYAINRIFLTARRGVLDSRLKNPYKTNVLYDPEGLGSCCCAPSPPSAPVARVALLVGVSSAPRVWPCACARRSPRPPPLIVVSNWPTAVGQLRITPLSCLLIVSRNPRAVKTKTSAAAVLTSRGTRDLLPTARQPRNSAVETMK